MKTDDKILIIDTSILCVYLKVPQMEECGKDGDKWIYDRVSQKIEEEGRHNTRFVLPLATIIETGNHIAHTSGDNKYKLVNDFADLVEKTIDEETPWIAFSRQAELLQGENLRYLLSKWRKSSIVESQSLGDASIADVANEFLKMGKDVEIFTGDSGLKNYENPDVQKFMAVPRRRQK